MSSTVAIPFFSRLLELSFYLSKRFI